MDEINNCGFWVALQAHADVIQAQAFELFLGSEGPATRDEQKEKKECGGKEGRRT